MFWKISGAIIFILGFLYIISPQATSINNYPPLPGSLKSDEPGDTYQNPNNAAYFSNYRRAYVTDFYKTAFENLHFMGFTIPAIKLNHPPEEAYQYVRDQQRSTYLEEYLYPMKDSIFVNGYEPYNEEGQPFDKFSAFILINDTFFDSKTTIRFYSSSIISRITVYLLMWGVLILLVMLCKKAFKEKVRIA